MPELMWEGKYDKLGRRAGSPRVALPFQTIETVNESAQERQRSLDLFVTGRDPEWRNRLIWGDKKYVLPSLLPEFAGQVDLIYIDPPFATGADFSFTTRIPGASEMFVKQPSLIEQKAYRDTWGRGLDGYLSWLHESLPILCELLADAGSLYVHLDWHVVHYAKALLDEIFGRDKFQNEIVWQRTSAHSDTHRYGVNFDTLLFYSKSEKFVWNGGYHEYTDRQRAKYRSDNGGRLFADFDLTASGTRRGSSGQPWRGYDPASRGNHWKYDLPTLDRLDSEGHIYWSRAGGFPRLKRYLDEMRGVPLQAMWTDIAPVNSQAQERVEYATQKPEALLERIIEASSNEGQLVLDCFCGSGTTAAVAEKHSRRWIAADLGRFAIHTTRKRLLSIPGVKPFVVQNLGKYERQAWQGAEFGEGAALAYRNFVLGLYRAQSISGYVWLHGLRNGHMVHVGSVDAPVSTGDVRQISLEFKRATGVGQQAPGANRVDVLGWDFAFELNEVAKQQAALAHIDFHFIRIPREVLDKRAVEQGDISFFELAALSVEACTNDLGVELTLTDFVIPLDDVPENIQRAISHWSQWIDYWAVDWDNKSDTFHNEWQTYRTRKDSTLERSVIHTYDEPGAYRVVVKVIDILGNDTTKSLEVEIR